MKKKIIEKLAHISWLRRNKPLGDDWYDWFKAEHNIKYGVLWLFCIILCLYLFFVSLIPSHPLIQYSWTFVAIPIIVLNWFFKWGMSPKTLVVILSFFIAFHTLTIQNQSLLKNIEHFELSNRPFIGIINQRIDIEDYTTDPRRGILPEVIYKVSINLKNYGKLPAYVENIECIVMDIEGNRAEPFMPYPGDKEKQWHNFDLFPDSTMPVTICPLVNIDAVKQLMLNDSLNNNELRNKNSKFWSQNNDMILSELRRCISPFYLIFQIKYHMIDDERKVYFYTSQFKIGTDLSAHLFNSSSKQWFKFDNNGQLTWLNRK